ncbi:MAG: hypothetical protein ACJA2S_002890, partial [Cyclobacteriaceae bacterium]
PSTLVVVPLVVFWTYKVVNGSAPPFRSVTLPEIVVAARSILAARRRIVIKNFTT